MAELIPQSKLTSRFFRIWKPNCCFSEMIKKGCRVSQSYTNFLVLCSYSVWLFVVISTVLGVPVLTCVVHRLQRIASARVQCRADTWLRKASSQGNDLFFKPTPTKRFALGPLLKFNFQFLSVSGIWFLDLCLWSLPLPAAAHPSVSHLQFFFFFILSAFFLLVLFAVVSYDFTVSLVQIGEGER